MTEFLRGNFPVDPQFEEKEAWAERFGARKRERTPA